MVQPGPQRRQHDSRAKLQSLSSVISVVLILSVLEMWTSHFSSLSLDFLVCQSKIIVQALDFKICSQWRVMFFCKGSCDMRPCCGSCRHFERCSIGFMGMVWQNSSCNSFVFFSCFPEIFLKELPFISRSVCAMSSPA